MYDEFTAVCFVAGFVIGCLAGITFPSHRRPLPRRARQSTLRRALLDTKLEPMRRSLFETAPEHCGGYCFFMPATCGIYITRYPTGVATVLIHDDGQKGKSENLVP